MNDQVRQKLQELISKYGLSLCDDPRRFEALLKDFCPEHGMEIHVLVSALRAGVVAKLRAPGFTMPVPLLPVFGRQLQEGLGMAQEVARWTVESWAIALGVFGPIIHCGWLVGASRVIVATPSGQVVKEINYYTNSIGMKLVRIPAGEFMMGGDEPAEDVARKCNDPELTAARFRSEYPQHPVRITRPFYMGAYEVTLEQYERLIRFTSLPREANGEIILRVRGDSGWLFELTMLPSGPVVVVPWGYAAEFCRRLSEKEGVEYRLPTEAEWEYACRAWTTTPFYTGATISTDQANYNGEDTYGNGRKGIYRKNAMPVGSFLPNGLGLYDMHGNVREFCQDFYGENYYCSSHESDPTGPASGSERVARGGSWNLVPVLCRAAARSGCDESARHAEIGFRVVCDVAAGW